MRTPRVLLILVLSTAFATSAQAQWSETNITSRAGNTNQVVLADLNHDGHLDVLAASRDEGTVFWVAGDGAGNFGLPTVLVTEAPNTEALAAGDINGDENIDIAGVSGAGIVFWLAGDGEGGFDGEVVIEGPEDAKRIAIGDVVGDAAMDLVITVPDGVYYVENSENEGFIAADGIEELDGSYGVAIADVNGDSFGDILTTSTGGQVSLFLGPNLEPTTLPGEFDSPRDLDVADLDGDGDVDVAMADHGTGFYHVWTNDGGTFTLAHSFDDNSRAFDVALADVTGDNLVDLVAISRLEAITVVYPGDGQGGFDERVRVASLYRPTDDVAVAAGDVTGDGLADIFVARDAVHAIAYYPSAGDAEWDEIEDVVSAGQGCNELTTIDVDGDNQPDVLGIAGQEDKTYWFRNDVGEFGQMNVMGFYDGSHDQPHSLAVADFNGDGRQDLVHGAEFSPIGVWLNVDGGFDEPVILRSNVGRVFSVTVGDFDNDNIIDIAAGGNTGEIQLHRGVGDGTFGAGVVIYDGERGTTDDLIAVDLDMDGRLDLVGTNSVTDVLFAVRNAGDDEWVPTVFELELNNPDSLATADFDGNGFPDLALTERTGDLVRIIYNTGTGFAQDEPVTVDDPRRIQTGDVDRDGDPDLFVAGRNGVFVIRPGEGEEAENIGGSRLRALTVGDFNRDGNLDAIACNPTTGHLVFLENPAAPVDSDGDGYPVGQDCNDGDPNINPGAREICGDAIDNDCDGTSIRDEIDADGDGIPVCAGDCNDTNPNIFPAADESCNGVDDNCNDDIDEDLLDTDEDGVCDAIDLCQGNDADGDIDADGFCEDGTDICPEGDDRLDLDGDETPDACDACPVDPLDDSDNDGSCDSDDLCVGDDNEGDADADGFCEDGTDICPEGDDLADFDGDGVPNACDECPVDNPNDADEDGVCDSLETCQGDERTGDTDRDGICDDQDICRGGDFNGDTDEDGICDDLDRCVGDDDTGDSDSDGVCDDTDVCRGRDSLGDTDQDGVCNDLDRCIGDDAMGDTDADGVCDDVDLCRGRDVVGDTDEDGVCDDLDVCLGDDASGDADSDGLCEDGTDVCPEGPDFLDADGDETPDDCDACPRDAADDSDEDGSCDSDDLCVGDDTMGDADGDGLCEDGTDQCPEGPDDRDFDGDGIPDACDPCPTLDEGDADEDGVCDSQDVCEGDDATGDSDRDGVCDDVDICLGDDASGDADEDGHCLTNIAGGVHDCNDEEATVYPGAMELCDGLDNACTGVIPNEEADLDGDGVSICAGDCDDLNAARYEGADEICDGLDNDCDGSADDEGDEDGDGVRVCGGDCADDDASIFPGAEEVCGDDIDNDCNDVVDDDEACPVVTSSSDDGCSQSSGTVTSAWPVALLLVGLAVIRRRV